MSVLILGSVLFFLILVGGAVATSKPTWGSQGHIARVPVDDFVVGDLPMVCARTGQPADGLVALQSRESGFQTWWLFLLVFGPLGIVTIAVMWTFARRPGRVGGSVPMTHRALEDQNRVIGWTNWAGAVPIAAFVAGVGLLAAPGGFLDWSPVSVEALGIAMLLVALLGGFLALMVASTIANRRQVSVVLDGTGRWVEVRNVHAEFARVVAAQVRARHEATRRHTPR